MKRVVKAVLGAMLSPLPLPQHPQLAGPGLHLGWRFGWVRGWLYRPLWAYRRLVWGGPRVIIGKRFSLIGSLAFGGGGGTIIFGDDVIVGAACTPFTHSPDAVIRIGARTFLNGTRFGCAKSIEIGEECILADARLMDTDFHAVHKKRNLPAMGPEVSPIKVGRNVWIAAGSAVLKGVEIGDGSVVAFGSIVVKSVPAGRIVGGNPAKDLAAVPEGPVA